MKRRINLLSITFTRRNLSMVIGGLRTKALLLLIILIIGSVTLFITDTYLQKEIEKFNTSKLTLTQFLDSNKEIDKQIKYFIYKYGLLNKYLKDDANSYFYFVKLQTLLSEVAPKGKLQSFNYKNTGETTFAVTFPNYDESTELLTAMENPDFLSNFEFINVQGFDVVSKLSLDGEFVLNFEAKIIKEDET